MIAKKIATIGLTVIVIISFVTIGNVQAAEKQDFAKSNKHISQAKNFSICTFLLINGFCISKSSIGKHQSGENNRTSKAEIHSRGLENVKAILDYDDFTQIYRFNEVKN